MADPADLFARFKLFVHGDTPRARGAENTLRTLCAQTYGDAFEIEVVDVALRPDEAEAHRIIVTPAILRVSPPPPRRTVGEPRDLAAVAAALDMARDVVRH